MIQVMLYQNGNDYCCRDITCGGWNSDGGTCPIGLKVIEGAVGLNHDECCTDKVCG